MSQSDGPSPRRRYVEVRERGNRHVIHLATARGMKNRAVICGVVDERGWSVADRLEPGDEICLSCNNLAAVAGGRYSS